MYGRGLVGKEAGTGRGLGEIGDRFYETLFMYKSVGIGREGVDRGGKKPSGIG
jgi:hypothetical protein